MVWTAALAVNNLSARLPTLVNSSSLLWSGSKGVINFPWIFFMQCGVQSLLGTSGIYPGTYSPGLFAGLCSDAIDYCLRIVSCETTGTK